MKGRGRFKYEAQNKALHIADVVCSAYPYNEHICADFLISKGFSKATRWFDYRWKRFRVYYKIEGYDCDILLSPAPQVVGDMTPEQQVDNFSDVDLLENHHYGDWHVYVNSIDNHLTTLNARSELIELMRACRCPLIGI